MVEGIGGSRGEDEAKKGITKVPVERSWILGVTKSLCPHQFDESGFLGLGCGTQKKTSLALVWSKCGRVGSHPEDCPSWSWVGHGEGPGRWQLCIQRKEHFRRECGD